MADHRVQRLGEDDRELGVLVAALEELAAAGRRRGRGCTARGRCGGSTCPCRGTGTRRRSPPRRRGRPSRARETIAGSTPPRFSRRNSRSAMFTTIWMWTHEWSDMSRRSAFTCCMYHQACRRRSLFAASKSASSLRLPRVGARISVSGTSTRGTLPQGEARTARRRPRPRDLRPTGVGHGSLQLPLPVLHAGRRPALARPRRGAQLRGDRARGGAARADGRDRPAAHRRRAARAAGVPAAGRDARARGGPRGPLADHERLPARARRGRAGRGGHHARERVDRLASARPLLPAHPARLAPAGAARARGDRRVPAGHADQGERRGAPRVHRGGGRAVRGVRPLHELPGALHRVHAAGRRPRVVERPGARRRGAPRDHRARASARGAPARAALDRARVPVRRRPAARSASSTRCPSRSARTATGSA